MSGGAAVARLPRPALVDFGAPLIPAMVEVAIPFFSGTVDEAVRQASAIAENTAEAVYQRIVGNAPTVLDVIEEIAAAIGNDPNFSTTMLTALATKLVKAANLSDLTDKAQARVNLSLAYADSAAALAGTSTTVVMSPALVAAVISNLLTQPNVLANLLPKTLPSQAGVPWLNGGVVSVS